MGKTVKTVKSVRDYIPCGEFIVVKLEGNEPHVYPSEYVVVEIRDDGREGTALVVGDDCGMKVASYPATSIYVDPRNSGVLVGVSKETGNFRVRNFRHQDEHRGRRRQRRR